MVATVSFFIVLLAILAWALLNRALPYKSLELILFLLLFRLTNMQDFKESLALDTDILLAFGTRKPVWVLEANTFATRCNNTVLHVWAWAYSKINTYAVHKINKFRYKYTNFVVLNEYTKTFLFNALQTLDLGLSHSKLRFNVVLRTRNMSNVATTLSNKLVVILSLFLANNTLKLNL